MAEEIPQQPDYAAQLLSDFNTKLRDIEEKQRLLKERTILIGQNLIETKEVIEKQLSELKFTVSSIKTDTAKIKLAVIRLTEELEKKARKSEVEIIAKQMKMFQPLDLARIEDVKKMLGQQ